MWLVAAEEDIRCGECYHTIRAGTECLSQMPVTLPEGFRRGKYRNFCLECEECESDAGDTHGNASCYARSFDHWYADVARTSVAVPCGHCGEEIPEGTATAVEKIYVWPEQAASPGDSESGTVHGSRVVAGVGSGGAARPKPVTWESLSYRTKNRFKVGGLGRGLGRRREAMARRLFNKQVPKAVRNLGEPAVRDFLEKKHISHIESVKNAPQKAKQPANVVLEDRAKNIARGGKNMKRADIAAAKSASRTSAVKTGLKSFAKGGAKAGAISAAMEAVVSVPENILHYWRGRKSGKQAAKDVAKDTLIATGAGVAAAGVAQGAALLGVSLSLGPAGIPLTVAGVSLMVGTATARLYKAAKRDLPLDEYRVYFCKGTDCSMKYAQRVTDSASGVGRGRRWVMALIGSVVFVVAAAIAVGVWLA